MTNPQDEYKHIPWEKLGSEDFSFTLYNQSSESEFRVDVLDFGVAIITTDEVEVVHSFNYKCLSRHDLILYILQTIEKWVQDGS